jgi:hypothetical protein
VTVWFTRRVGAGTVGRSEWSWCGGALRAALVEASKSQAHNVFATGTPKMPAKTVANAVTRYENERSAMGCVTTDSSRDGYVSGC